MIPLKSFLIIDFCTTEKARNSKLFEAKEYVRVNVEPGYKSAIICYWDDGDIKQKNVNFK
jgi:hypothetical protein